MTSTDFVSLYGLRATEYVIAVSYLLLFALFWRALAPKAAPAPARARAQAPATWFALPDAVKLHPGHAWARVEDDGLVSIGLDDFGHKLIGELDAAVLPVPGTRLEQGRPGFVLHADGRRIDVLSPVDGEVAAVNDAASADPNALHADPYGSGWLLRLKPNGALRRNMKQLLAGDAARLYMERAAEGLRARLNPELGALAADGGQPVHGFAREIEPLRWDALVREALLTDDLGADAEVPRA